MSELPPEVFSARPVATVDLPLAPNARLLHPDRVMIRVNRDVHDVGAYCYTVRDHKTRKPRSARGVAIGSFCKERVAQVRQVIKVFSIFMADGGLRPATVSGMLHFFRQFMDWADANGCSDCLSGGESTRRAYRLYTADVEDRYRRHEFEGANAKSLQLHNLTILEAITGISDLGRGIRFVRKQGRNSAGTEPASESDFASALALNESIFQGLCRLVLDEQPFPFKLSIPKSASHDQNCLWVFPANRWILPPHQWGEARAQLSHPTWANDYQKGRLATVEEISHHYLGNDFRQRWTAGRTIQEAAKLLKMASRDPQHRVRRMLAMVAQKAFLFLFLANTGGNQASVLDIETDGDIDESTANPGYRSTKWRAHGKQITLVVPVAFVPSLRRYMELRRYLLKGEQFPNMFFTLGGGKRKQPGKLLGDCLVSQYTTLRRIDPSLPAMRSRKIRATVSDYYKRRHDAAIEAAVLQHTESTADASYTAGTEFAQQTELSLLLEKIAYKAQQQVVANGTAIDHARPLEDGGVCPSYGKPEAIADQVPVLPNCKTGCLFCAKRVLIAGEEDARKVASAAFVMEQLIMGPLSEAEFRPQIVKCDDDLAKIRAFEGCADMVDRVKLDVYQNGNLTPYFADKYQLFLALGVL